MIKKKIEFFVGLFILLGITSFLILLLQISEIKDIYKSNKEYKIKASFKNIGTLKEKSKVTIGGVKVGIISKIELSENSDGYYPKIEMLIRSDINKIPIDSSANILTSNLLGDNYIQIELGNEISYLKDGDTVIFTTQAIILEELISKLTFDKNL